MIAAEALELLGMAEQRPPSEERRVDGRLVPGVQEQDERADQLVLGEALPVVDHGGELGDQVLAGPARALPGEGAEVVGELDARADGLALRLDRGMELVHAADVRRPRPEEMPLVLRHPEHLGDHGDGQRLRDGGEQIDDVGVVDLPQQAVDDRLDARPQALDVAGRERLRHEPPHARVIGRLHVEDAGVDQPPERLVPRRAAPAAPSPRATRRAGTCVRTGGRAAGRSRRRAA